MTGDASDRRRPADVAAAAAGRLARASSTKVTTALGGRERTRVILLLASVLALASADSATVGASAIQHSSSWRALSRFATVRFESVGASQKVAMYITKMTQSDLEVLRDLLVAGKVTPVIDRCYDLSDVSEAFRYFEEGHAKGKIVVSGIA